jgi:CRISPR-associated endoribonuclease Cas6
MRIKLKFKSNTDPIRNPLNSAINGFMNRILGDDNEYHGKFSNYSVSTMQGGKMDNDGILNFPNGGYFFISSPDNEFMNKLILCLPDYNSESYILDMKYDGFDICDFIPNKKYDIVRTISPIIAKEINNVITFHDDNFIEHIRYKSIKKLIHNGISEDCANSIKFILFHPENAKTKLVKIKKQKNIANQVMFIVKGNIKARKALYELGIGKCTGFGFGSVEINNFKNF